MNIRCAGQALVGLAMLLGLVGCGNAYKVSFEVSDVINAWGDPATRDQLDVDILTLTSDEAKGHPTIVSGAMRSDEWFAARESNDPKIAGIAKTHIYAFRRGGAGDRNDTLMGPPLVSGRDARAGQTVTVEVKHPQRGNGDAAIVIFGRFNERVGLSKSAPLVIKPPPRWTDELIIRIGPRDMTWVNRKN